MHRNRELKQMKQQLIVLPKIGFILNNIIKWPRNIQPRGHVLFKNVFDDALIMKTVMFGADTAEIKWIGVFKKYQNRRLIYQNKWTMNDIMIFSKIVILAFNAVIPARFWSVEPPLIFFFWYGMKPCYHKFLVSSMSLNRWDEFSV